MINMKRRNMTKKISDIKHENKEKGRKIKKHDQEKSINIKEI